ncbi:hypothetical protein DPX16_0477 [Anabarilius grahami]|uniref:Uncharacterized protein n=1 Tax=Anabarilius grahami TaxID=495550 RepID=A0A3N0YKZ9_ANAGA|nr:hypothetical protein DPX16_0477 [Anabarilius grahami]
METDVERVKRSHDYVKQTTVEPKEQLIHETPNNSPAKKAVRMETPETVSNNTLLAAINKIGETQQSYLEKLMSVENAVKEIKEQVTGINGRLDTAEEKLSAISAENKMLRNKVNELESYQRRWNLKISGIPEQDDENVKMTAEKGNRLHSTTPNHRAARTTRDRIWIDAKNSEVLKQKKIKITEDLTQCVKDARAKLWPLEEEARRQKKIAGFKGPFAIIDGKRISVDDLN